MSVLILLKNNKKCFPFGGFIETFGISRQDFHIQDWNIRPRASKGNEAVHQYDTRICGKVLRNANSDYLVSQAG